HQRDDLTVADPIGPRGLPLAPRIGAAALDLAALECKHDRRAARIAGHDLEPGAEELVGELRIDVIHAGRTGGADDDFLLLRVFDRAHAGRVPDHERLIESYRTADPVEARGVILDAAFAKRLA